ncbi:hypothetical protein KAR91_26920, partial [Candidatus Pacearchaeota archaeon]|nr:hypothetical protein [Candidatus Pacearchaeota archaeon]
MKKMEDYYIGGARAAIINGEDGVNYSSSSCLPVELNQLKADIKAAYNTYNELQKRHLKQTGKR